MLSVVRYYAILIPFEPKEPRMPEHRLQKILVAHDAELNRQMLADLLVDQYSVITAQSGEQALALALSLLPDLILMGVEMQGLDGYEVLRQLKADERTASIGVIFVTSKGTPEDEERGLLLGASDYIIMPFHAAVVKARVALHLQLSRQRRMLEALANVDGLTEIPNRRQFDTTLTQEWARSTRSGQPLSLALMDVDFFKQYNDLYGHAMGDRVLKAVATALRQGMKRHGDLVARYGGEEFVLVMPDTTLLGAQDLADKMREAIASLGIPHEHSSVASIVTVSVGVACKASEILDTRDDLLKLADDRLYRAKASGRNRTISQ